MWKLNYWLWLLGLVSVLLGSYLNLFYYPEPFTDFIRAPFGYAGNIPDILLVNGVALITIWLAEYMNNENTTIINNLNY